MIDSFGRTIDYLRISITDRCNFRCIYCMPEDGADISPREELLSSDEIIRLCRIGSELGVRNIRITGGEPLVRKDILEIVRSIRNIGSIEDISLTTNGMLLPQLAMPLKEAGLSRVNISLDTMNPVRFKEIARRGDLKSVLDGIDAALNSGLEPVKINVVALRGKNDDEIAELAGMSIHRKLHVRFIELMPIDWTTGDASMSEYFRLSGESTQSNGITLYARPEESSIALLQRHSSVASGGTLNSHEMRQMFISYSNIKQIIEAQHGSLETASVMTKGPAKTFRISGAEGTVGFISQITNDICATCNRMRITSDGCLRPCLMAEGEVNLRTPMRNGATDADIADLFLTTVKHKPFEHRIEDGQAPVGRGMSRLGG